MFWFGLFFLKIRSRGLWKSPWPLLSFGPFGPEGSNSSAVVMQAWPFSSDELLVEKNRGLSKFAQKTIGISRGFRKEFIWSL